ncbi:unnamed protein product [Protopolystoma xenopodis]|uniref:PP2A regulatory subunit B'' EF-hand domain-containing protein n=1 Tax=Protopolystoma xenopodis TaxID=117903 RepID=A0A3S5BEU4_9PLAT|nr:unnamed protein product [Protopolystoma xenopodis]
MYKAAGSESLKIKPYSINYSSAVLDILEGHPGLAFLQKAKDFHSRYVTTVVARIFFSVNSSWSGRISIGELRRSNFLSVLNSLQDEDDINLITQYFSYEHFYVIYCKFWEIDDDHDLIITKADLTRHNNYGNVCEASDFAYSLSYPFLIEHL